MCLLMFSAWVLCSCHCQLPVTAIREIKILNELSHCSMVKLLEVVTSVGEVSNYNSKQTNWPMKALDGSHAANHSFLFIL